MTKFQKSDAGKPHGSGLVRLPGPAAILRTIARKFEHGAAQYGRDNWRGVESPDRYKDALLRHAFSLCRGELLDEIRLTGRYTTPTR